MRSPVRADLGWRVAPREAVFVASVSCRSAGRRELGGAGRDARHGSRRRFRACRRSYTGIAAAGVSRLGSSVAGAGEIAFGLERRRGQGDRVWAGALRNPGRAHMKPARAGMYWAEL